MVEIKKMKKGDQEYYYLVHSYREGKKVKKIQSYLGKEIPKNIEELKINLISNFYKERFLKDIDKIKNRFTKEQKNTPKSGKEKQIENFAIKFTYNSQRIEGSTLTLKETADLIERGITPTSKPIRDVKEAESHKKLFGEMMKYERDLNLQTILSWNRELLNQTKPDIAGKIRTHQVGIARSKFMPPLAIELQALLKEFFDWYNQNKDKLHPVELAALTHLKFVTIHPFGDGNGRISRIMMNFVLKKHNFPLLDIAYQNRNSYYNALERSQVKKDEKIFLQWFFKKYLQEYKNYLK
jgi:Fic family protein